MKPNKDSTKRKRKISFPRCNRRKHFFNTVVGAEDKPAEPASPKQKARAALEAYLVQLDERIVAIKKMTLQEYDQSLKNDEDTTSADLLNEIYFFLDLNLGKDEAASFKKRPGVTFTSVNDWGQSAFKANKWQGMIDCLTHYTNQVKKIIEKQD